MRPTLLLALLLWAILACQPPAPEPAPAATARPGSPAVSPPPPVVSLPAPAPVPTPTPTPAPPVSGGVPGVAGVAVVPPPTPAVVPTEAMVAADFPAPPDRDLPALARQLRWGGVEPGPASPRFAGRALEVGDRAEFWVMDYPRRRMASKEFRLAAISENAYWWLEDGLSVSDADLQGAVRQAEEQVYPRVSAAFGAIPELGSHRRGHIINGRIPGVGGYVSAADLYPVAVNPYSNEVPAIYINAAAIPLSGADYLPVLAHELQHAIHWYADPTEATWLNEGLSELAVSQAGYTVGSIFTYLRRPDVSLVNWPDELGGSVGRNYGGAALFAHYLWEHYAAPDKLPELLAGPANGIAAVDAFLQNAGASNGAPSGEPADFHTVFADWMVANLLDGAGKYGYADLDIAAAVTRHLDAGDTAATASLPQYAVDYLEIKGAGDGVIHFEGEGVTPLLPEPPPGGSCWWSNRGDAISTTLTRRVAVPETAPHAAEPKLTFRHWYHIEQDWDYLYLEASTDGGRAWRALPADGTTTDNPLGNSYGPGYTGGGGWRQSEASLADYAGREILLRFHYVTDDAIHAAGYCVREMRLTGGGESESHYGAGAGAGQWQPDGFVQINNRVRQDWIVRVIVAGPQPSATPMALHWDAEGERYTGSAPAPVVAPGHRIVVAVSPTAPATMQPGRYRVWAVPAN